jgi:hypothetical protein
VRALRRTQRAERVRAKERATPALQVSRVESFFPAENGVKLIDFIQDLKNSETRLVLRPMNNNVYSEETNGHGVIMTS